MNKHEANTILAAMKEIVAENFPEMTAQFGKTKFDTRGEIDFNFSMVSKSAEKEIAERDTNIGMSKNKIHPEIMGMEFVSGKHRYVVESIRTRKQKYPVVAKRADGKLYRFTAHHMNTEASDQFGTTVRYVGNMAILKGGE
jgi:hypothetical protein